MIEVIEGSIFKSKANFLINFCDTQNILNSKVSSKLVELYPHIEKEFIKYCNYCKKNKIPMLGTVQYVPTELWSMTMVNTMRNDNLIDYDKEYQYIVNMFVSNDFLNKKNQVDLRALERAFVDIRDKAEKINAIVGIPSKVCMNWKEVNNVIEKIFDKSNVEVEIVKYIR